MYLFFETNNRTNYRTVSQSYCRTIENSKILSLSPFLSLEQTGYLCAE